MKASLLASAGGLLVLAAGAGAQLGGLSWSFNSNGGNGYYSDDGSTLTVTGNDDGFNSDIYTDYYTNAPSDGTVSFDWSYTSPDSGTFDGGYDQVNFGYNFLAYNQDAPTGGSSGFNVLMGDNYGFGVWSEDGGFGPGTISITNFKFTPVPAPGAAALMGAGGLIVARRRRA